MVVPTSKRNRSRARRRAKGLRPVRRGMPDTRRPGFADACRRQSLVVAASPGERELLHWSQEAASTIEGWE